jgi:DNA-binding transcriptional MocR family regulator
VKLCYLIPSYHNPTSIVTSSSKREEIYNALKEFKVPIIEDGFNEELRYTGSHIAPMAALQGEGNSVVYIGSFSKILFPGLRIGWILADDQLISILESVKRSRNIHTSSLDQAILYEYLKEGNLEKYIKSIRKEYKNKYEFALNCAEKYIPYSNIYGEGGMHIFIKLKGIDAREVLNICVNKNVIFTPGDIFYVDGGGRNTLRLGISRNSLEEIDKGFKIIGDAIYNLHKVPLHNNSEIDYN